MDRPQHVMYYREPPIFLALDGADEDDEEWPARHPRLNIPPFPEPRRFCWECAHLGPGGVPRTSSDSIAFASRATFGSRSLFSSVAPSPLRPSLDKDASFYVSPQTLGKLMKTRSLLTLSALGGIDGLANRLMSHRTRGLSCDDGLTLSAHSRSDAVRKAVFGSNKLPDRKAKTIWACGQEALQDRFLWLLVGLSTLIIAMSLVQPGGGNWMDGITGILAVAIVTTVAIATTYILDRKYTRMLKMTEDRQVKVIRGGSLTLISIHDIMVGDILTLEQGDLVPADGLLISGNNIKCDESCDTGESELVAKSGAPSEGESSFDALDCNKMHYDPFIISGSKVMEGGAGRCLVTGVGVNSIHGRLMQDVREARSGEQTPLQQRVGKLTESVTHVAISAAMLVAIGLLAHGVRGFKQGLKILELAVTIILVSVPEGLPMSVLTALIFGWHGMYCDRNLVRKLSSCETMGNATTICCDKTGTLTMNQMSVTEAMIGKRRMKGFPQNFLARGTLERITSCSGRNHLDELKEMNDLDPSLPMPCPLEGICPQISDLFVKSITINSTAFESKQNGARTYVGSGTETALLRIADSRFGSEFVTKVREKARIVEVFPFDSRKKCMATVTKLPNGLYRMYVKGAPEIVLARCNKTILDPSYQAEHPMADKHRRKFLRTVKRYGSGSLRTLALAYRDFGAWPPHSSSNETLEEEISLFQVVFQELVFLGLVGIEDPLRPGVHDAVSQCQNAGITVRLVTGDSVTTAKAVATSCGILDGQKLYMYRSVWEGPEFRELSPEMMEKVLPNLRVLARSSPEDKKLIVTKLKELGETVAVTGDGTNDGPALRAADVGFAMGVSGTEVAKEASSIVLLDDNFASIVKAIAWGRSVYDAVRRFLQFQLTANTSVLIYTAVSAMYGGLQNRTFFTTAQLLWINLIMDILGAVALSTDGPDRNIMKRRPERRDAPLLSLANWKMITGQAAYQLLVGLIINLGRENLAKYIDPGVDTGPEHVALLTKTMVFNTYICMLFFNLFNSRRPDNKINILKGISMNKWFTGSSLCIIVPQVLLISFGGEWLQVTRLNVVGWVISLCVGFMTIPLGFAIRCIPDETFLPLEGWIVTATANLVDHTSRLRLQTKERMLCAYHRLAQLTTYLKIRPLTLTKKAGHRLVKLGASLSSLFISHWNPPPPTRPSDVLDADQIYDEESALVPDERAALLGYNTAS